ncbi:MAG: aminopeptidase N [Alphaproteobacteria bacterium]|nr:aminopeptidase N [Alphaproteobacteria bacterium]
MRTDEPRAIHLKDYRAPDFRIATIDLDFILRPEDTRVAAKMRVQRTGDKAAPLVLDGEQLNLLALRIDGKDIPETGYRVDEERLTIGSVPEEFVLDVITEISPQANTSLEGLYLSKGIFCTQCEPEGFRRITYYIDRPDNLAVFSTRIEADKQQYPVLLSNGNLTHSGELPEGRHFALWSDPFPKPSYLFALVAGDLGHIEDELVTMSGRKVALRIYVEHGNEPRATYAMDSLKRAMRWDEEKYGREYDLDIFMIVAVSAFNFGAMENKGLNIFNDKVLLASPETATDDDYARIEGVVAHEYFHNWTGDRITCRDWFQLSLKEGLTVFRDAGFSGDMRSAGVKRIEDVKFLRMRQFQEDAGPLAHPVQPQSSITIDNFYTATVYEKGAEIIGMLKTLVGDEGYRKATDLYFERHDGQAVTIEEWVKCFEDACGRDLRQFRLWYRQAGTPTVEANGAYDGATKKYALTLKQTMPPTPGQPSKRPMQIPVRLGLVSKSGRALPLTLDGENAIGPDERVIELTEPEQRFIFVDVDEEPLPSIGRRLSAPVHFKVPMSAADRAALMSRDTDPFNRWEAGQALATDVLLEMADTAGSGIAPRADAVYVDAADDVLARADDDHAFAAEMLVPPSEAELALRMQPANPEAIHDAREALIRGVAEKHRDRFEALYANLQSDRAFAPDAASAGRRRLRNLCLRYLTAADDEASARLADRHYRTATNMTDMVAGLAALSRMDWPEREPALAHFHDRFANDPLVLDKWMSLQAMSPLAGTIGHVRALMRHPAYDKKNPNRVRALIGAFSANHLRFHEADGSGYVLLAEVIRGLDSINPQVAARMAAAFENWRRYDEKRQALMRGALEGIANQPGLSTNLFEVTTKMLA